MAEGDGLYQAVANKQHTYTITLLDKYGKPADPLGLEIVFGDQYGNELYDLDCQSSRI